MSVNLPVVPGTVTLTNNSDQLTGVGTAFTSYRKGYSVVLPSGAQVVLADDPTNDYQATLTQTYSGTTQSDVPFTVTPRADGATIAHEARLLFEGLRATDTLGVSASWGFTVATADDDPGDGYVRFNNADFAAVTEIYISDLDSRDVDFGAWLDGLTAGQLLLRSAVRANKSVIFQIDGIVANSGYRALSVTHIAGTPDFQSDEDLVVVGALAGPQGQSMEPQATVDDLAGRAAHDGAAAGYRVLVNNSGDADGRAAIYSKNSVAPGDWSQPAYLTGPKGAKGDNSVVPGPIGATGIVWRDGYNAATTYALNEGVTYQNSSWRALGTTTGNLPPLLPETSNAHWALIAGKGADGNGTGDVVGPASSADGLPALFDGATGKLLKSGPAMEIYDAITTHGNDIASATSINLTTATGSSVDITGTATLSTVVLEEGAQRYARCVAALSIVASSTLIVDGATSGTTTFAAGDLLRLEGGAAGVVRVWRLNSSAGALNGHIFGLTLSNSAGDVTNDIDVASGEAASSGASPVLITLTSPITKKLDGAWAVGTDTGGLDIGSIANTTYHIWIIRRSDTGVVDALFSTSATAPTMPSGYDQKRRIGSIIRTGGAILPFVQDGDSFVLSTPVIDESVTASSTSAVTVTLDYLPTGVRLEAMLLGDLLDTSPDSGTALLISDLSTTDTPPNFSGLCTSGVTIGATNDFWAANVFTNTSAQIRARVTFATDVYYRISVKGWFDRRERLS